MYNVCKIETIRASVLRGRQRTIRFPSQAHTQHRQNAFKQNHFFMFLSDLRVKSSID